MPAQQRLARLHGCLRPHTAAALDNSVETWSSFSSLSLSIRPLSLEDIMVGTAFHASNEERQRVDDDAAEAMVAHAIARGLHHFDVCERSAPTAPSPCPNRLPCPQPPLPH